MKMKVKIFSCLLTLILSCNVTAEIIREVVEEKNPVTLPCPHPMRGDVMWSRETNGHKVNILTAGYDRDIRHNDPGKRYSSSADQFKSLYIGRVNISDSGRYLCNNEPAADLTVIPPGTIRLHAAERTSITLTCPPDVGQSDVPTWSRDAGDIRQTKRFIVSPEDKTLTIKGLKLHDSGLYYCDGKPAAYLTVTKDETSDGGKKTPTTTPPPPPTTPTTTTTTAGPPTTTRQTTTTTTTTAPSPPSTADSHLWIMSVRTVTGILYLIIMISITVTTWRKTQQKQKRLTTETETEAETEV